MFFVSQKNDISRRAFTLIELLIVIAILSVLASAVIVVLNPQELLSQSRDTQRTQDIESLNKAISLYQTVNGDFSSLQTNIVYISLSDSLSNCGNISATLAPLPAGWSYSCKSNTTYRAIDGSGWIPLDLRNTSGGSPISSLPIDPINTVNDNYFYTFSYLNGRWEINARMESIKFSLGGGNDRVSTDGGDDFTRYEAGTDITILPWSFDFKTFTIGSTPNKPEWTNVTSGTVSLGTDGDGTTYARSSGQTWSSWRENIPFNPNALYKVTIRIRQVTDPTINDKKIYMGWVGIAGDGVTAVASDGTTCCNLYHVVAGSTLVSGSGWTTFTGYTKGYGSPNGDWGPCGSSASPCKVHSSTRYLRPFIGFNYQSGNGIADIDYYKVEKQ